MLWRSSCNRRLGLRDERGAADNIEKYIDKTLRELKRIPVDKLVEERYEKIRRLGTDAVTTA